MTQKTKLEIIGSYTPEHEGPFCTRDGRPVRVVYRDMKNEFPIIGLISNAGGGEASCNYDAEGMATYGKRENACDLMNAREVPVAREFWVVKALGLDGDLVTVRSSLDGAEKSFPQRDHYEIVHVCEVLPGEGA